VGPAISLPIFTGGRIRSNVAVQKARWKQTQILYQSTVLNSLEETENALVNYSQEQERRDRLQAAVSQNQTALELSRELYTSGLGDFLAVLDAQRQLYGNEDLLAQSQTAVATNLIALYKALGGGWESFPHQ
jgi:outer membrane protein TolC